MVWGAGFLLVVYFGFFGDYNLYRLWQLHQQGQALGIEKIEMLHEKGRLAEEIEWLQNDSTYIEKVAREKFNMARPGEKIYLIKTEETK